ncbi:MAG: AAA family ATPase [Fusobacteriaceae bacterium]|jgi:predicted AAA+ superfamily ATPase|nr:AAA family ATPase [Fusobacteriaceae bacterium]
MSEFSQAILVTGARQVGKTTMLRHLAQGTNRTYVSLYNSMVRILAKEDPVLFFQTSKPPIIIDEIQYATELFTQIKIICDNSKEIGLFWLIASQGYKMMKGVSETLAGRIIILTLFSLSTAEKTIQDGMMSLGIILLIFLMKSS